MNRCVSIFGGIGTKQQHYKHAIDVYKSNGYNVLFYENKNLDYIIPRKHMKIAKHAMSNDSDGVVIHCNSGGLWTGMDYLAQAKNNKLLICEAGPLQCDTTKLIRVFENLYKFKCPGIIYRNIDTICDKIGIPTKNNHEWHAKFKKELSMINNLVCLTSNNDKIIDNEYINKIIADIKMDNRNAIRYTFDKGNHWNISKSDTQKYQDIIQNHLNEISKKN